MNESILRCSSKRLLHILNSFQLRLSAILEMFLRLYSIKEIVPKDCMPKILKIIINAARESRSAVVGSVQRSPNSQNHLVLFSVRSSKSEFSKDFLKTFFPTGKVRIEVRAR